MKEYIFQISNNPAGNDIVVANAPTGLVAKNILAIINMTTGNPVHSPVARVIDAVTYSGTTMTITLDSNAPSIAGDLLIKIYSDASSDLVADFFGIVETPDEEVMSKAEAIGILEETWLAVTGSAAPHTDDWDGSGSGSGE